jgi:thiosulfate/3-mercaptopyruvate sulfurtransferase
MRAARVAWMLEYAGAPKVFLLEGGFRAWRKSHFPIENKLVEHEHKTFRLRPAQGILATADEIRSDRSAQILDVRSQGEFSGREGRGCDRRRGRIPHARWIEWTNFVQRGQRFKTRSEIGSVLKEKGLRKNSSVVVTYCHRGARAAAAYYALRSLGYGHVKNYVGSWHEWSAREHLPLER